MHQTDFSAYLYLKEQTTPDADAGFFWHDEAYKAFLNQPLDFPADLFRYIAYAYSGMYVPPVIIEYKKEEADNIIYQLHKLRQGDMSVRSALLDALVPMISNSLVGSSRVLHLVAPDHAPLYDTHVHAGWRKLFTTKTEAGSSLPAVSSRVSNEHFLSFWDHFMAWKQACNQQDVTVTAYELCERLHVFGKSGG